MFKFQINHQGTSNNQNVMCLARVSISIQLKTNIWHLQFFLMMGPTLKWIQIQKRLLELIIHDLNSLRCDGIIHHGFINEMLDEVRND